MSNIIRIEDLRPENRPTGNATTDNVLLNASPLQFGGGGGTYNGMDVVDAKIAAAEARTDTKFAQVLSRLDSIEKSTSGLRLNTWLAMATGVGLALAAMAFGATNFGNGIMVTTAAIQDASDAKRIAAENAAEVKALRTDIQGVIQALQTRQDSPQQ